MSAYWNDAQALAAEKWEELKRRRSNGHRLRLGLERLKAIPAQVPARFELPEARRESDDTIAPLGALASLTGGDVRAVILASDVVQRALLKRVAELDREQRQTRMDANIAAIRQVDERAGSKLAVCHDVESYELAFCSHVDSLGHEEVTTLKTRRERCWLRVCPKCAKDIAARLRVRYAAVIAEVVKPNAYQLKHLVLTLPRGDDLADDIKRLHLAAKKLVHKFWKKSSGEGAFATIEIGPRGGNVHAHCVVYGHYVEQEKISNYWRKLTGAPVVWIKAIDPDRALGEAIKYVCKLSGREDGGFDFELKPDDLAALHMALKGKRRAWAWGSFYGLALAESEAEGDVEHDGAECATCHHVLHVVKVSELRGLLHLKYAINYSIPARPPALSVPAFVGPSPGAGP